MPEPNYETCNERYKSDQAQQTEKCVHRVKITFSYSLKKLQFAASLMNKFWYEQLSEQGNVALVMFFLAINESGINHKYIYTVWLINIIEFAIPSTAVN